jgi:guanidinoacetate N-methyltransferase
MSIDFARKRPWGEIRININSDEFIRTGRSDALRSWFIYRLLSETVADLEALDAAKENFITGSERPLINEILWTTATAEYTEEELIIAGQQVMQAWEARLMAAMAEITARSHGDVLEVGFGMGISASMIQERGVASHTIIELNDDVLAQAHEWRSTIPDADIRIVHGSWQDTVASLGKYDAVLYDTYPVSDIEVAQLARVPFPADFFVAAKNLLRPNGAFTYYTNEIDSLSRWHQRHLLENFNTFTVQVVRDLNPPPDCHYWWAPSMAVVYATV